MKQVYLLIVFLVIACGSYGQKIRFTDTSNVWYQSNHYWDYSEMCAIAIKGDTLINGTTYQKFYSRDVSGEKFYALIREDSTTKKIYYWSATAERVLYDFSLNIGDTISYQLGSHYVKSIDSVKIDSFWYKTFYFESVTSQAEWPYTVIENIGCVRSLDFPIFSAYKSGRSHYLNCFFNNGIKPTLSKTVGTFDNQDSCYTYLIYVSVDDISAENQAVVISLHPANASSVIALPGGLLDGELYIYNTLGQTVKNIQFNNTSKITIGQLPGSGVYHYRVCDKSSGKVWQGKLVYE